MPKAKAGKSQVSLEAEVLRLRAKLKEKDHEIESLSGAEVEPDEAVEMPGASKAQEIVDDLKGQGSFEVYKLDGGKQSKLATHDIDAWPEAMESLVKSVGPGDYLTIFRDGEGKQVGRITRTFDKVFCGVPTQAPRSDNSDLLAKFLEIQARKDETHERTMMELRAQMQASSEKNMGLIIDMVKSMTASPMRSIKEFAEVQKLLRPEEKDPADRIFDALELADELRGRAQESDESPLIRVANKFAEGLLSQAPRRTHTPNPNPPPSIRDRQSGIPKSSPEHAAQLSPEPEKVRAVQSEPTAPAQDNGRPSEPISLAAYIPSFKATIEAGYTAQEAVQVTMQRVGPDEQVLLKAACVNGDWLGLLEDPFLKDHFLWLEEFRARLKEALLQGAIV